MDTSSSSVNYLEHAQFTVTITHPNRGSLAIDMTSPQGTEAMLLSARNQDRSKDGFKDWTFMSVHTWGENPIGLWSIYIRDVQTSLGRADNSGILVEWKLTVRGTTEKPNHQPDGGRVYGADYNSVKDDRGASVEESEPEPELTGNLNNGIMGIYNTAQQSDSYIDDFSHDNDDDSLENEVYQTDDPDNLNIFETYQLLQNLKVEAAMKEFEKAEMLQYLLKKGRDS
uniref:Neuroendocrine convertase 1-like n=1 Tax=Saccoglossus kowalevskii TaxID=10224 RepID=A0ABM0MGW0_SACKO|nr:PREDICTED: neuroendocrine convertase 1-like [Saccoglossus kowalevskii]